MTSLTSTGDVTKPHGQTPNHKLSSNNKSAAISELEFYKSKFDK